MSCRPPPELNRISYLPPPTRSPTRSIKFSLSISPHPTSIFLSLKHAHTHTHTGALSPCRLFFLSLCIHTPNSICIGIRYMSCVCVACRGIVLINQRPCARKRISLLYCNLNQQMQIIFLYIYSRVRCGYLFDFVIACRRFASRRFSSLFPLRMSLIYLTILYTHYVYLNAHPRWNNHAPLVSNACVYAK